MVWRPHSDAAIPDNAPCAGAHEDLAAAHHLAPSAAAELGDFHHPHADESVVQTSAFTSIPAFRSSALQHSSTSDPAFRDTIAGSLGGIGPGFAGSSSAFSSPRYGAPGCTSSGYHGMQVWIWNNARSLQFQRYCTPYFCAIYSW